MGRELVGVECLAHLLGDLLRAATPGIAARAPRSLPDLARLRPAGRAGSRTGCWPSTSACRRRAPTWAGWSACRRPGRDANRSSAWGAAAGSGSAVTSLAFAAASSSPGLGPPGRVHDVPRHRRLRASSPASEPERRAGCDAGGVDRRLRRDRGGRVDALGDRRSGAGGAAGAAGGGVWARFAVGYGLAARAAGRIRAGATGAGVTTSGNVASGAGATSTAGSGFCLRRVRRGSGPGPGLAGASLRPCGRSRLGCRDGRRRGDSLRSRRDFLDERCLGDRLLHRRRHFGVHRLGDGLGDRFHRGLGRLGDGLSRLIGSPRRRRQARDTGSVTASAVGWATGSTISSRRRGIRRRALHNRAFRCDRLGNRLSPRRSRASGPGPWSRPSGLPRPRAPSAGRSGRRCRLVGRLGRDSASAARSRRPVPPRP